MVLNSSNICSIAISGMKGSVAAASKSNIKQRNQAWRKHRHRKAK